MNITYYNEHLTLCFLDNKLAKRTAFSELPLQVMMLLRGCGKKPDDVREVMNNSYLVLQGYALLYCKWDVTVKLLLDIWTLQVLNIATCYK